MRAPSRRGDGFATPRIAIVRALPGLGDLLCILPACRAIRAALPRAEITLIGLPWARAFVARFPAYFDAFLEFPGYPGIVERPLAVRRLPGFLADAQERHFDLVLQMHGSGGASNPFALLLGARETAGFYVQGAFCPDPARFLLWTCEESEVQRYLRLAEHLGFPSYGEDLEFPILRQDRLELRQLDELHSLRVGDYACIHPGANDPARRWPPGCFAAIGDALAVQGLRVVLTGTAPEGGLTAAVARAMRAPSLDLAGRTSLGALAALLEGSRLLVCNDTGVSHLAAALWTPSVVIFLSSDPLRWAPRNRGLHRVVDGRMTHGTATALQASPVDHGLEVALAQVRDLLSTEASMPSVRPR